MPRGGKKGTLLFDPEIEKIARKNNNGSTTKRLQEQLEL